MRTIRPVRRPTSLERAVERFGWRFVVIACVVGYVLFLVGVLNP